MSEWEEFANEADEMFKKWKSNEVKGKLRQTVKKKVVIKKKTPVKLKPINYDNGIKFLYTNIKQWISSQKKPYLFVRGRTKDGNRVNACFYGFNPRFFAKDKDIEAHRKELEEDPRVVKILKWKGMNHHIYPDIEESIFKDKVSLILTRIPTDIRNTHKDKGIGICNTILKDCETFQSHLLYELTFLIWTGIKSGIDLKEKPDKYINGIPAWHWTKIFTYDDYDTELVIDPLDIENYYFTGKDPSVENAKLPITAISVKHMGDDNIYFFSYNPDDPKNRKFKDVFVGAKKKRYTRFNYLFDNEISMLEYFIKKYNKLDSDLDTAWNSNYDFGYIISRCRKLGVNVKKMSPWYRFMKRSVYFRKNTPFIAGKTIVDETKVYMKHTFFEGLKHSYKLNDVSKDECNVTKVPHEGNTGDLVGNDFKLFRRYNCVDTELVELIDEVKGLWRYREHVRRRKGVPIEETLKQSVPIHNLFVRESMKRGMAFPNRNYDEKPDIKGGLVFDPSPGLHKGTVAFDFKSLYPHIIWMFNLSVETILKNPVKVPVDLLNECIRTPNGLYVLQPDHTKGLVVELMEGFIKDRDGYKQKYLKAFDKYGSADKRTEGLNMSQMSEKADSNSVYGIFWMYNPMGYEAIPSIGREAVQLAADLIGSDDLYEAIKKAFGDKIQKPYPIYGDTDSVYAGGIDPRNERLIEFIGEWVSEEMWRLCKKYNVKKNLFKFRAEASYDSFFMLDRQKAYAGRKIRVFKETVSGGQWRTVNKFSMTGFEKSDISKFGNKMFKILIEQVCLSATHDFNLWNWTSKFIRKIKYDIDNNKVSLSDLSPATKLERPINTYGRAKIDGTKGSIPIQVQAASYSNEFLYTRYIPGDKIPYLYVKAKNTNVIALPEGWTYKDIEENGIKLDYYTMYKKQIVKKFKPVMDLFGFKMKDLEKGVKQVGLRRSRK
jgi:DNA polymerase elongation subunit (family B)